VDNGIDIENCWVDSIKYRLVYSQTCIKRSHLGQRKHGLIREMTS